MRSHHSASQTCGWASESVRQPIRMGPDAMSAPIIAPAYRNRRRPTKQPLGPLFRQGGRRPATRRQSGRARARPFRKLEARRRGTQRLVVASHDIEKRRSPSTPHFARHPLAASAQGRPVHSSKASLTVCKSEGSAWVARVIPISSPIPIRVIAVGRRSAEIFVLERPAPVVVSVGAQPRASRSTRR
jgi:hypothetical protein